MRGNLRVLAVDDERPALDELTYLLEQDERVGEVLSTQSATEALVLIRAGGFDAVFLDIQMPGLNGIELAHVLAQFRTPPDIVFVTAHEEHALDAFDVRALDYVLKPVRADRLAEALRRLAGEGGSTPDGSDPGVRVERGGVTRFINRADILHVEAHGDYVRLHTAEGSFLLRVPLGQLEAQWAGFGFVRIHRSSLAALAHVTELRMDGGRCSVRLVDGTELVVSRRQTRELRERYLGQQGSGR
ncbi:LytR/AlgR family response regulator transcription factor [Nocardioides sp.]|uniref:LytR/AlgR family response regulator transcription factor n=1 Tax=Nocardioides sp. TaxID=35761 RepID=UPI0035658551